MKRGQGFTLLELMVTVAIVAILASIALPAYTSYVRRGRITDAFNTLGAYQLRMEQGYQDNGNYGTAACAVAVPAATTYFTYACALTSAGQAFGGTATGRADLAGYAFTIDDSGNHVTTAFPHATVPASCWMTRVGC